jgi:hypothetical protein
MVRFVFLIRTEAVVIRASPKEFKRAFFTTSPLDCPEPSGVDGVDTNSDERIADGSSETGSTASLKAARRDGKSLECATWLAQSQGINHVRISSER